MKRGNPEQIFHQSVAQYLAAVLPPEVLWTTIGHGGGGKVRGALLKSMGVLPGVADVLAFHDGKFFAMELKSAEGKLTEAQSNFLSAIEAAGGYTAVCKTLDRALACLEAWQLLKGKAA